MHRRFGIGPLRNGFALLPGSLPGEVSDADRLASLAAIARSIRPRPPITGEARQRAEMWSEQMAASRALAAKLRERADRRRAALLAPHWWNGGKL